MIPLNGLFSTLLLSDVVPDAAVPQLTTYDTQRVLGLCKELMQAHADVELPDEMRATAVAQLQRFRDDLRFHRIQLSGNACRDLIGNRRVRLDEGHRFKAKTTLIALVERTLSDITLTGFVA